MCFPALALHLPPHHQSLAIVIPLQPALIRLLSAIPSPLLRACPTSHSVRLITPCHLTCLQTIFPPKSVPPPFAASNRRAFASLVIASPALKTSATPPPSPPRPPATKGCTHHPEACLKSTSVDSSSTPRRPSSRPSPPARGTAGRRRHRASGRWDGTATPAARARAHIRAPAPARDRGTVRSPAPITLRWAWGGTHSASR